MEPITPAPMKTKNAKKTWIWVGIIVVLIIAGIVIYKYWYVPKYVDKPKEKKKTDKVPDTTLIKLASETKPEIIKEILQTEVAPAMAA